MDGERSCGAAQAALLVVLALDLGLGPVALPGCAGSQAGVREGDQARVTRRARPFQSGERLVFRARVSGVDAARATLSVGTATTKQGREVLPLRVTVEGYSWLTRFYPLKIKLITDVDADTLRPLRMRRKGTNGSVDRTVEMTFKDRGRVDVLLTLAGQRPRRFLRLTRSDAFDAVSGLYDIRAWLLAGEAQREMTVFDGAWSRRIRITKGPIEDVWTLAGWVAARRFEVEAERVQVKGDRGQPRWEPRTERFTAWVTEDEQLVPVRLLGETPVGPAEVLLESRSRQPAAPAPQAGAGETPGPGSPTSSLPERSAGALAHELPPVVSLGPRSPSSEMSFLPQCFPTAAGGQLDAPTKTLVGDAGGEPRLTWQDDLGHAAAAYSDEPRAALPVRRRCRRSS